MFLTIAGVLPGMSNVNFSRDIRLEVLEEQQPIHFYRIDNRENRNFIMLSREWITDQFLLI